MTPTLHLSPTPYGGLVRMGGSPIPCSDETPHEPHMVSRHERGIGGRTTHCPGLSGELPGGAEIIVREIARVNGSLVEGTAGYRGYLVQKIGAGPPVAPEYGAQFFEALELPAQLDRMADDADWWNVDGPEDEPRVIATKARKAATVAAFREAAKTARMMLHVSERAS